MAGPEPRARLPWPLRVESRNNASDLIEAGKRAVGLGAEYPPELVEHPYHVRGVDQDFLELGAHRSEDPRSSSMISFTSSSTFGMHFLPKETSKTLSLSLCELNAQLIGLGIRRALLVFYGTPTESMLSTDSRSARCTMEKFCLGAAALGIRTKILRHKRPSSLEPP